MKTIVSLMVGAIFCSTLAVPALAQNAASDKGGLTQQWMTKPDGTTITVDTYRASVNLNADELRAFQSAKDTDASLATELAKNPNLVANDSYVSQHPALQHFLEQYPNARQQIQENPENFLTPTQGSTWNASTIGKTSGAKSE